MWHDIAQGTDEWLDIRAAKLTGSAIAKVMAHYPKPFGDPAKDLAATIAVEKVTGKRVISCGYSNSHMERGHEEEPIARAAYEDRFFVDVGRGGFYDNGDTGSSPDGNVMDDGLIEIKSAIPSVHYGRIKKGGFDSTYKWQFLFNLRESGREWIDFVSYCSSFPEHNRLYVHRITREEFTAELEMIDLRVAEFLCLVDEIKKTIAA